MGDNLVPFSALPLGPAMFCAGCGADRTVPPTAADPGPCPKCGSTVRSSCRPAGVAVVDVASLVGEAGYEYRPGLPWWENVIAAAGERRLA